MTNKETITNLEMIRIAFVDPITKEQRKLIDDTFDMAIKTLEQEPKILNTLDFAIDASSGDTNYFVGFRNGLRYSKSLIDGKEPQFESCTEQEPKTGHWIPIRKSTGTIVAVKCECCGGSPRHGHKTDYCPNCGAKMESEDR